MTLQGGNVILTFGEPSESLGILNLLALGALALGAGKRDWMLNMHVRIRYPEPGYRYSEFANGHWGPEVESGISESCVARSAGGRKWNLSGIGNLAFTRWTRLS